MKQLIFLNEERLLQLEFDVLPPPPQLLPRQSHLQNPLSSHQTH